MTRVAVFVDYQNAYMRAREAFGEPSRAHYTLGQIDPARLGEMLRAKGQRVDANRALEYVRVYRGEPEARHSATAHGAWRRQVHAWAEDERVRIVTRPMHYRPTRRDGAGKPTGWVGREKGIDVLLAIDLVVGALRDAFDVAVLMSADTDLVPALESAIDAGKRVEVASWRRDRGYVSRLTVPGRRVWCHHLGRSDFEAVRDDTDYTKPVYLG